MKNRLRLIVFLVPPEKIVNGGILSIFSICKVSRQFKNIHGAEVVISTYPGTKSYKKNDLFENNEVVYSFDEIVKMGDPEYLMLHVPEYASWNTFLELKKYQDYLNKIPELHVNIMNQNILLMQKPHEVASWFMITPNVTQTTAHNRYSKQELADNYYLPTHHLSTFVDASQYKWVPYDKKQNVIGITIDETPEKEKIVSRLRNELPEYKIVTIKNMRYEEYKDFISKARFTVTFGEGFDGYYVEAFFSGGITLAVYNEEFFPDKDFSKFGNTYTSYSEMLKNIVGDIKSLDNKQRYEKIVSSNFKKITELYSFENYVQNIKSFYMKKFTFKPNSSSAKKLLASIVSEKEKLIDEKNKHISELDNAVLERDELLREKERLIQEKEQLLQDLLNSKSWKITKPLRKFMSLFG